MSKLADMNEVVDTRSREELLAEIRSLTERRLGKKPRIFKLCPGCVHQAIEMLDRT